MENFYWIFTVFVISPYLLIIWLNLRELLAKNSRLQNLSKNILLKYVIGRGLYTMFLFVSVY